MRLFKTENSDELKKEIEELNHEIRELKLKHKIAEEDTKHMVKLKEERLKNQFDAKNQKLEIDFEKKEIQMLHEKDKEVAAIKDDYRVKVEEKLESHMERMSTMYGQIVERLPDVNYSISHDIAGRNGESD